jgi:hypothetical protein
MLQTKVVEKSETHILFSITFIFNHAVFEIMWENVVERGRPQTTKWRMRIACWIPKATNTHTGCVILISPPTALMVSLSPLNLTSHILGLVLFCFVL